jgi:CspA family cold shock protein
MARHLGSVIWFSTGKGFGFLQFEESQDVFCHSGAILGEGEHTLDDGEPVEFDVEQAPGGRMQAANVIRLRA